MSVGDYAKQAIGGQAKKIKQKVMTTIMPVLMQGAAIFLVLIIIILAIQSVIIAVFGLEGTTYSSSGLTSGMASMSGGIIVGGTIQEKVWYGIRSLGYSEISTAAAMGNIHYESGTFDPNAIEGGYNENNGGIGICQWTNNNRGSTGRNTNLKAYAQSKETTWRDEDIQVEFLLAELSGGGANGYASDQLPTSKYYEGLRETYYSREWKEATDTETLDEENLKRLTEVFCFIFERPGASYGYSSMDIRFSYAKKYYEQFHGRELTFASSSELYNADGSVNEAKMQELECALERDHNLVTSGNGFYTDWNNRNVTGNNATALKRKVTGTFHGYNPSTGMGNNGLAIYQCTWWANGRASEYLSQYGTKYKKYPTNNGNGGDYYLKNKNNGWFEYGSEPRPNSIFSYNNTSKIYGHVVYVEAVDYVNKYIYVSEAGGGTHWAGITKKSFTDCQRLISINSNNYGFIYLDKPK